MNNAYQIVMDKLTRAGVTGGDEGKVAMSERTEYGKRKTGARLTVRLRFYDCVLLPAEKKGRALFQLFYDLGG